MEFIRVFISFVWFLWYKVTVPLYISWLISVTRIKCFLRDKNHIFKHYWDESRTLISLNAHPNFMARSSFLPHCHLLWSQPWPRIHLQGTHYFHLEIGIYPFLPTLLLHTPWCRTLFEKLIVTQLVKKYPFLQNPNIHYCVHTSLPLDPILSQLNPVCPIDPYHPKVHLNIIRLPMPRFSQWSLSSGFPTKTL